MQKGKSHIKDSGDFINKIKSLQNIPEGAILVTADVVGLYPSIPHETGLKALSEALDNRENKQIPKENLLKMAEFVLKNNYFEFNGKVKKQLSGTVIGTMFAPTYTSIFMDKLESDFPKSQELTPLLWYRYIDDVFFIWIHGKEKLASFIDDLNNYHPNIKFTHESNKEHIPFLDLNVRMSGNKLSTGLYIKPTDRHQYLHYTSSHPEHTKKSVVYTQALRLSRTCLQEKDFKKHIAEIKSWFSHRGYPQKHIETETSKVKFSGRRVFHRTKVEKGVPLVVTYHPLLKTIEKIIHDNLYLLYMNEELKRFLHQVLWSPSEALGRSVVTWLELSCIQLKGQ